MFLPTNAIFKTHLRVHVDILAHLIDELSAAPLLSCFFLIFRDDSAITRPLLPLMSQCHWCSLHLLQLLLFLLLSHLGPTVATLSKLLFPKLVHLSELISSITIQLHVRAKITTFLRRFHSHWFFWGRFTVSSVIFQKSRSTVVIWLFVASFGWWW